MKIGTSKLHIVLRHKVFHRFTDGWPALRRKLVSHQASQQCRLPDVSVTDDQNLVGGSTIVLRQRHHGAGVIANVNLTRKKKRLAYLKKICRGKYS